MGFFAKINQLRMSFMRSLAKNVGADNTFAKGRIIPEDVKRVLITRPNGRLGNLLLTTPLIQEVAATFPNSKIDIFVKGGLAPILLKNYPVVDRIICLPKKPFNNLFLYLWNWLSLKKRRYDLVINAVEYSSSGRLSTKFARSRFKFFGGVADNEQLKFIDYRHIAKNTVYNLRTYLRKAGVPVADNPIAMLDLKLTAEEIAHGKAVLHNLTDNNNKNTIALFTYATGNKRYTTEWWEPFYEQLKDRYPDYTIIEILPVENVSQLNFSIPSFYSKDVREIGAVIANTKLFIGADSGIMHLASASHTPTIGLFKMKNVATYQPYGNNSFGINTTITTKDQWFWAIDCILTGKNACKEATLAPGYASRPA